MPRLPPTAFDARFALPRPSCIPGTLWKRRSNALVSYILQGFSHNKNCTAVLFGRTLGSLAPLFSKIVISRLLVFCLQRGFPEAFSKDFHVVTKLLKPMAVAKTSSKTWRVVGGVNRFRPTLKPPTCHDANHEAAAVMPVSRSLIDVNGTACAQNGELRPSEVQSPGLHGLQFDVMQITFLFCLICSTTSYYLI